MIDFTAKILVKAMHDISSWDIINKKARFDAISIRQLQRICFHSENDMDETALLRKLHYLKEWINTQLHGNGWTADARFDTESGVHGQDDAEAIGIFDLVHCLTANLLTINRGRVVYRYKYLKTWNYLSGKIGQNLLITSIYAMKDYKEGIHRTDFHGTDVIYHDNQTLNEILDRGMSENHFHLRCSIPYFLLSWLSLMNSVTVTKTADLLDMLNREPRNPKMRYSERPAEEKFSMLHLKAAAIRVYLYAYLTDQLIEFGEYYASVEMILEHILATEPVYELLHEFEEQKQMQRSGEAGVQTDNQVCGNLEQYLENVIHTDRMKRECTGFIWFVTKCFPNIPMSIFMDGEFVFSRTNREILVRYVEKHYEPLLLRQCAWLYRDKYWKIFRREWMRQTNNALERLLKDPYSYDLRSYRSYIQHVIDGFHASNSRVYKDYALTSVAAYDKEDWNYHVLMGERWLIYEMERRRFDGRKGGSTGNEKYLYHLFFLYLVIKESFRSELLQNNDKIGFRNFQTYQKRKTWFTTSFTEGELAEIAVKNAFRSQNLECLEVRVVPQESGEQNIRMIKGYDRAIGEIYRKTNKEEKIPAYFYVFHFRKQMDRMHGEGILRCRHEKYRQRLKKLAWAMISMRVGNPDIGVRLKGIDACSSEDGCRPEVFAVVFRTLKQHTVYRTDTKKKLPQLRVSYHVGEENQDVLDGLRAIDEAVYFLNLGSGDRLGHATMLGICAEEWYMRNDYKISIRQQDYLDNVVWMYHRMVHYHISNKDNLLEYLEGEFQKYFNLVYERNMSDEYNKRILDQREEYRIQETDPYGKSDHRRSALYSRSHTLHFNIHNYYYAWELRGDDPHLYADGFYNAHMLLDVQWDDQRINPHLDLEKRDIAEAAVLYHMYHYNDEVRKEGDKPVVVKIPYYMVQGIGLLQKSMQKTIAKRGISIETNPSSNLMIGGLSGYDSHPIVSFYNRGLTSDMSQICECPQINVSINTDNAGVFATTLYNEHTLMAYALENKKNMDGTYVYKKDMVYEWIDHIREMGNMQSFSKELRLGDRSADSVVINPKHEWLLNDS